MVRAEVKIGAPQKKILDHQNFFQALGQKLRPRSFKWRPLFALFQGGGGVCKRWYFGQICAPVTMPLRSAAPLAPPLLRPWHWASSFKKHSGYDKQTCLVLSWLFQPSFTVILSQTEKNIQKHPETSFSSSQTNVSSSFSFILLQNTLLTNWATRPCLCPPTRHPACPQFCKYKRFGG